jgi:ribosomal protein S18 acetylase RimI-like enzyme
LIMRNPIGLVKTQTLTLQQRAEVEQLAAQCRQCEGLDLAWIVEPARALPDQQTSHLLYFHAGVIVGSMSCSMPAGPEVELCGIVHPDHRRKGIGRALLAAAVEEYRQRGVRSILLVSESISHSGRAFVEAVGARYRFSEYRMELDPAAIRLDPHPSSVQLERAHDRDAETLIRLTAASFADPDEEVRPRILQWLQEPDQRFYIGKQHEEPIGSLRLFLMPDVSCVYINSFGVLPEYRGMGYGRQILAATIDMLMAENWKQICIEVNTENPRALSVYHACGFKQVAAYEYYQLAAA